MSKKEIFNIPNAEYYKSVKQQQEIGEIAIKGVVELENEEAEKEVELEKRIEEIFKEYESDEFSLDIIIDLIGLRDEILLTGKCKTHLPKIEDYIEEVTELSHFLAEENLLRELEWEAAEDNRRVMERSIK